MSYTTGFLGEVTPLDDLIPSRRNLRPVAVVTTVIGFGSIGAALVIASMAATSVMLDAFSANPDPQAVGTVENPIVLARPAPVPPAPAPAPRTMAAAAPVRAPDAGASAKPSPVTALPLAASAAPEAAPPTAAALPSPIPLPPARSAALSSETPVPVTAPLPPSRSAMLPTTTPRTAPPPVVAATSLSPPAAAAAQNVTPPSVASPSSSVASLAIDVPLPPRRPAGSFEVASLPQTEAPPAYTRPNSVIARTPPTDTKPQGGETRQPKSAAATDATTSPPPDNRNFFQRLFGGFSQPSTPSAGGRAAIYDISAHTVYLPNGERLEAHSGLGGSFDDPRTIREKNRGVTPPNVYQLSLRQQLFHGVPALRLNPVNEGGMFGRVGMLAHTYMLGGRGDSNGCVSFRNYNRFLEAYKNGEITHLVVVAHAGDSSVSVASAAAARPDRDVR